MEILRNTMNPIRQNLLVIIVSKVNIGIDLSFLNHLE